MGKRFKQLLKANKQTNANEQARANQAPSIPQGSGYRSSPQASQSASNTRWPQYSVCHQVLGATFQNSQPPPPHNEPYRSTYSSPHRRSPPTHREHYSNRPPLDYGADRYRSQNSEAGYEHRPNTMQSIDSPNYRHNGDIRSPALSTMSLNSGTGHQFAFKEAKKQEEEEPTLAILSDDSDVEMEIKEPEKSEVPKHKRKRNRYAATGSSSDSSGSESDDEQSKKSVFFISSSQRRKHGNCFVDDEPGSSQDAASADFEDPLNIQNKIITKVKNLREQFRKTKSRYDCIAESKMGEPLKNTGHIDSALASKENDLAKWVKITNKSPTEWWEYVLCRMNIRDIESIREWPRSEARRRRCIQELLEDLTLAKVELDKNSIEALKAEKEGFMAEILSINLKYRDPRDPRYQKIFEDMIEEAMGIPTAAKVYCSAFAGLLGQFGNADKNGVRENGFNAAAMSCWYTKVIKKVGATVKATAMHSSTDPRRLKDWIENFIFYRAKLDMETGYVGRVVAILQAFIEFHCRPPENVKEIRRKEYFKSFLQCGYPLIGEEGANGWNSYSYEDAKVNCKNELRKLLTKQADCTFEEELVSETEIGAKWKAIEEMRSKYFWMPSRFDHGDAVRNLYVDPFYISDTLTAFPPQRPAFRMILRLFQILGINFGPNPVKIDDSVLENDNFSALIRTVLPKEFGSHFTENVELSKFLVNLMVSCLKIVPAKVAYPLVVGIGETIGWSIVDQLDAIRDSFVRPLHECKGHRRDVFDFARVKLLEVECNVNEFYCSFGPISDQGSDSFAKSDQFRRFLDELPKIPVDTIENSEDRCFHLWVIVQMAKRLASIRGKFGRRRKKPPTLNRCRLIALAMHVVPRKTPKDFLNMEWKTDKYDYDRAIEVLAGMFQNETSARVPDIFNVTGSTKDLLFTLYVMMVYETTGNNVYLDLEESANSEGKDKTNVKMCTYATANDNPFADVTRLEVSCALVKQGAMDEILCRKIATSFLRKHPFLPAVWKCVAPFLSTMKAFGNPFSNSQEPRRRAVHSLLEFCAKWADAKCNLRGVDITYIRKAFKNIREGTSYLPYPDSTVARLRVLVEEKANSGESASLEALTHFPFAKLCVFDDLTHVKDSNPQSEAQLREISELMNSLGHRVLTSLTEIREQFAANKSVEAMDTS